MVMLIMCCIRLVLVVLGLFLGRNVLLVAWLVFSVVMCFFSLGFCVMVVV